jgi:hypothetical protein
MSMDSTTPSKDTDGKMDQKGQSNNPLFIRDPSY